MSIIDVHLTPGGSISLYFIEQFQINPETRQQSVDVCQYKQYAAGAQTTNGL